MWKFPDNKRQTAIITGDWKVVGQHQNGKEAPSAKVYHLSRNPGEKINLAAQHPDIIEQASIIFAREHQNAQTERFSIQATESGLLVAKIRLNQIYNRTNDEQKIIS